MFAYYGGSFDPPHIGHINCVIHGARETEITNINLMPCKQSPLKTHSGASQKQRLAMLELACNDSNNEHPDITMKVDPIEFSLPSPSYTINTLAHLRETLGKTTPLCFILGEDSLYTLHKWKNWQTITHYCHIIVMGREGLNKSASDECNDWIANRTTQSHRALHLCSNGLIYFCQTPLITISSSEIRDNIVNQLECATPWLTKSVADYIATHNIYTPE